MNNVVTLQKLKTDWLQIRIREEVKEEFAIAAELRGATMSGLVLQFIMKTIREEKAQSPESFPKSERRVNENKIVAHIGPAAIDAEEERREAQKMIDNVEYVRNLGELTDERKRKRNTRKAGRR